jgi:predicted glutamine amidotransferase
MLGIVSKKSAEREWLERFRRLAHTGLLPKGKKGHKDGWGIGFFDGGVPRVLKEPEDAYQSAFFSEVLKKRLPTRLIAHLRHASHGLMTFEHTHPFIIDDMLFCHNGTIYAESEEESDSEFYFESIVRAHKKDPLKEAIIKTAEGMKKKFRCTSLSLLLITPRMLLAYRDYKMHRGYYTLFFARRKDAIIVCSEKLDREKWTFLDNKELLCVYNDLTFERGFYG